jgi:hypothetical protein
MPHVVSFVAAEGVAIDQLTARVTAFNMLDHVLVARLPARVVRISALTLYELGNEAESFKERVQLLAPDGNVVSSSESDIALTARDPGKLPNGHRSIHVLWAVPIEQVGDYRLVLEHRVGGGEWRQRASLCITASLQEHPILNAHSPSVSVPSISPPVMAPESE